MNIVKVSRRDFVKLTSAASAGLVLGLQLPRSARAAEGAPFPLGTFVEVGTDGIVTIYVSKSDMGQGVRTTLPMIVAEEMDADWKHVRIRQADLDKKYGRMGTGGSSSVRTMWTPMRQAGAAARAMLVSAAAAKWSVDAKDITVSNGVVAHGAKTATFGELAEAAAKVAVPKDVTLKDPAKFTIVGKKANRLDNPDLVVGKAHYGIDVRLPGMLYATVLRAPVFGAKVASFDATKAKAVPGVKHVVQIDAHGNEAPWAGVGVIATSTWAAMKGRDALDVKWDAAKKDESSATLSAAMHAAVADGGSAKQVRNDGDVAAALSAAAKKLEATYEVPYLAHATMEPMNATASYTADGLELWLPTQFADWNAGSAGGAVGTKNVKVHVTMLGGGFGRRAFPDFAVEAALLSKAAGAPVKVQWTREDDMQHDFYRPASVHRVVAALDANNKIAAWHHRMAGPAINSWMGQGDPAESEVFDKEQLPPIANARLDFANVDSVVPRGWWRSVENTFNAFAVQSMMDELAHAAGKDPIEFQLSLIPAGHKVEEKGVVTYDADRLRRVIELARDKSGWGKPLPAGRARGFAAWFAFHSYVAEIAEVSVDKNGAPRVHRVVTAIDCGIPVNPDGIAAQVEGAIVYGLTAALQGAITIDGGAVQQSNFHDYPLLTIDQMPVVETHIVPSTAPPTGTGEPGTPPIAPAVTNAMFVLTGKRVRKLPIIT
ncbi:MAG TPA: xanthine dehydrogenase family protein molybdopterin-binding subunit [Thermoanaerobaculia bacterium]|nr:xanthine dehydrogenase family protein molybdopterin-binding subunit [Thermoanaerobaculia bacterium]